MTSECGFLSDLIDQRFDTSTFCCLVADPDPTQYVWDEQTGYYYDHSTGLYYDANSQVFISCNITVINFQLCSFCTREKKPN